MSHQTRIKICGISHADDAIFAESLGVDTIGLVFFEKSPRNVSIDQALEITKKLGGMMGVVALFHNAPKEQVFDVLTAMPHLIPQFHGAEDADYCQQFGRPYLKAFGMGGNDSLDLQSINQHTCASAVLLDANTHGAMGGTGHCFDWTKIPQNLNKPLILAGGLNLDNVAQAVREVRPYAVDVSSGVESERGIKSQSKMKQFVDNVRGVPSE